MTKGSTPVDASDPVLGGVRSIRGARFLFGIVVLLLGVFVVNLVAARHNQSVERTHASEAAITRNSQFVAQDWWPAPDGMILTVRPNDLSDSKTLALVRRSMKWQRGEYLRADYSAGQSGGKDVPGRATLEYGTSHNSLNCEYREVDGGAELRWYTNDSVMIDALREWAAATSSQRPAWAPV